LAPRLCGIAAIGRRRRLLRSILRIMRQEFRLGAHWKKNRIVHPKAKDQIIQHGECPGSGRPVNFYYGEAGQFCPDCRKVAEAGLKEERTERLAKRELAKKRNR
jgi:hypothetical protein